MPTSGPAADPEPGTRGRRRASHSLESVVTEAVALLDEAGEPALTFRALAARLGGGVASIYWYVANREELLDKATDHVLSGVVAEVDTFPATDDPIADLRAISVALFAAIADRPWLGAYLMRDTGAQPHAMLLFERLGQQVLRLRLSPKDSFDAVSAVLGFVVGTAADLGQQLPREVRDGELTREEYTARFAEQWRALDPATFPFVHHISEVFATHDDRDQFEAGLDLLLAGLRLRAGR